MSEVVSFTGYIPPARFDDVPWIDAQIDEASTSTGTWATIDTVSLGTPDANPANPQLRSFTTVNGTAPDLWYRVIFLDGSGGTSTPTTPVQNITNASSDFAANSYITSDDVKATLILDGTTYADVDVDRAVDAANASIDQLFGRKFVPDATPTDRYYSVRRSSREVVEIDDLTRTSAITVTYDVNRDSTFAQTLVENTDFYLAPFNAELDGKPFEQIRFMAAFPAGRRTVAVNGTFGWPSGPPGQIVAFAELLAVKFLTRIREAPFGVVTAGADMGVAMRIARTDPDFPTLSAGLCKGALIS